MKASLRSMMALTSLRSIDGLLSVALAGLQVVAAKDRCNARCQRLPGRKADDPAFTSRQVEGIVGVAAFDIGFDHHMQGKPGCCETVTPKEPSPTGVAEMESPEGSRSSAL
jgi:hypothetical protein